MKTELRPFEVSIPTADGKGIAELIKIEIPMEWDEEIAEWLMTDEGLKQVEETKARHMGLLLPSEMKALRDRLDLTQKAIGELLQIGEKTWTRWETGKTRPSRSVNLLLRALYDRQIHIEYLKQANHFQHYWGIVIAFPRKKELIHMDQLLSVPSIQTENQRAS